MKAKNIINQTGPILPALLFLRDCLKSLGRHWERRLPAAVGGKMPPLQIQVGVLSRFFRQSLSAAVAIALAGGSSVSEASAGYVQAGPGTSVRGRIIDDAGEPVAGATVTVELQELTDRGSWRSIDRATLETAPDGHWEWTYRAAPEEFEHIVVGYFHPDYVSHPPGASSYVRERFKTVAELQAGATRVLERGVPLEGIVLDAEGEPVTRATVELGAERTVYNRVPEHLTGADGRFRLAVRPDEETILTVTHPGHAPEQVRVVAKELSGPLRIQLPSGRTLRGQVVDAQGEPVRGARISVREWRGTQTLRERLHTDREGRFQWDRAPEDPLAVSVLASGYAAMRDVIVQAGDENRIELISPPSVRGRVVDAETGEPVRPFYVAIPENWYVSGEAPEPRNWKRDESQTFDAVDGSFEIDISGSYQLWAIRIEADGYRPEESPIFEIAAGDQELTFELEPAKWAVGRVTDSDGSVVTEVDVFLVQSGGRLEMIDGEPNHTRNVLGQITDSDGRFSFPPQEDGFLLVAFHEAGYAEISNEQLADSEKVILQPWGRIEGEARVRGAPAAGHLVATRYSRILWENHLSVSDERRTMADADGNFTFEKVPPGEIRLSRMQHDGRSPWITRSAYQHPVAINVEPGEATTAALGGTGRPVVGRISLDGLRSLEWSAPLAEVTGQTEDEPTAQRVPSRQAQYQFIVEQDGSFRIEDLDADDYSLRVRFQEGPPHHREIATVTHDFTVPELEDSYPYSDEPLDLGVIEVEPKMSVIKGNE